MIGCVNVPERVATQVIQDTAARHATSIQNTGEGIIYLSSQPVVIPSNSLPLLPGYGTVVYPGFEVWAMSENGKMGTLIVADGIGPIFATGV